MIAYTKAYGMSEAVRKIHLFMQQQKDIIETANKQQNEKYE